MIERHLDCIAVYRGATKLVSPEFVEGATTRSVCGNVGPAGRRTRKIFTSRRCHARFWHSGAWVVTHSIV